MHNKENVQEKIKQRTEWFRLYCTLFVLDNGGIGFVVSKYGFYIDNHLLSLLSFLLICWVALVLTIIRTDKKIDILISKL